jgi:hypothetical protein
MERIKEECKKKMAWLNEMIGKQNELPLSSDPVVTTSQIKKEMENLSYFVNPIFNKPKPKVEKKPEPKKEDDAEKKEDDTEKKESNENVDSKVDEEMNVD